MIRLSWNGRQGAGPSHISQSTPGRDGLRLEVAVSRGAPAVAEDFLDLAQGTAADQPGPVAVVAQHALAAAGEDAAVACDGIDHGPAFLDGQALGLLAVDVLAVLAGLDGDQGVPVVGRADQDGVDVGAGQHVAEIVVVLAVLVLVVIVDDPLGVLAMAAHDIADGDHLDLGKAQEAVHVAGSLAAAADRRHDDPLAGRSPAVAPQRGRRDHVGNGDRRPGRLEKPSPVCLRRLHRRRSSLTGRRLLASCPRGSGRHKKVPPVSSKAIGHADA